MQTLLTQPRQVSIVPAPRAPERTPAPGFAPRLALDPALSHYPALLRAELDELLDSGIRTLEVDVSAVPVLPVRALRCLVDADSVLRCRGGRLHVLNPTPRTVRVLAASRTMHLTATSAS